MDSHFLIFCNSRSVSLDKWTEKFATHMKLGGNKRARDYLDLKPASMLDRYSGERAEAYREMLRKEVLTQLGYVKYIIIIILFFINITYKSNRIERQFSEIHRRQLYLVFQRILLLFYCSYLII